MLSLTGGICQKFTSYATPDELVIECHRIKRIEARGEVSCPTNRVWQKLERVSATAAQEACAKPEGTCFHRSAAEWRVNRPSPRVQSISRSVAILLSATFPLAGFAALPLSVGDALLYLGFCGPLTMVVGCRHSDYLENLAVLVVIGRLDRWCSRAAAQSNQ